MCKLTANTWIPSLGSIFSVQPVIQIKPSSLFRFGLDKINAQGLKAIMAYNVSYSPEPQ